MLRGRAWPTIANEYRPTNSEYENSGRLFQQPALIVKCQDEVYSNRQRFNHVEIMREYAAKLVTLPHGPIVNVPPDFG